MKQLFNILALFLLMLFSNNIMSQSYSLYCVDDYFVNATECDLCDEYGSGRQFFNGLVLDARAAGKDILVRSPYDILVRGNTIILRDWTMNKVTINMSNIKNFSTPFSLLSYLKDCSGGTQQGGGGLSDGDYGDMTISGDGKIITLKNDIVGSDELQNTTVVAGTYNVANITVDAQGRITSASAATADLLPLATPLSGNNNVEAALVYLDNKPAADGSETKINAGTNVSSITGSGTLGDPYVVNVSSGTATVGDGNYGDVTISNGVWTVTGGGSTGCQESITQAAHGFSVGNVVYINTSGDWVLAQADVGTTIHDAIITEVTDSDNFTIQFCGLADITGQTYTVGVDYYTSETTAGDLRNTAPTKGYVDFIGVGRGGTKIQLKDVNAVYTGIDVPTGSFLLDIPLSPANVAYSLRKLSSSYTGNVITVRRASDDLTTNIGFDVNGDLDQSALTTFCASTDCFVSVWYDQTGNSLNAAQTTNTKQPKIVTNGVVETENSNPTIVFDGVDDELEVGTVSSFNYLHNGTSSSVINVSKYDDVTNEALFGNNRGANSAVGFGIYYYNTNRVATYCTNGSSQVLFNQSASTTDILSQHLLFTTVDADNSTASNRSIMSINDAADFSNNTTSNSPSTNDASFVTTIGNSAPNQNNNFEGNIQELVIFSTDQSSLKSSFLTNINSYYAIY